MGVSVFIASGKGGVGKTSLTAGISCCLAAMSYRVLCIDADAGLSNLDILLGLCDRTALDLNDVLRGDAGLENAAVRHDELPGLYLLNAPADDTRYNPERLPALCKYAATRFDYVFIDCPAGIGENTRAAAAGANRGIIVASPDCTALRDAERAARLCETASRGSCEIKLVLNRTRQSMMKTGDTPNVDDAMDAVGLPLLGVVPEDERVIAASNRSEPLVLTRPDGAAAAYLRIARRIAGELIPITEL